MRFFKVGKANEDEDTKGKTGSPNTPAPWRIYIYIYITKNYIVIEIPFHKKLTERFLRAWPKTSSCGGHAERSGFEMGQLLPAAITFMGYVGPQSV